MSIQTADELRGAKCKPCEGGIPKLTPAEAERQLAELDGWRLNEGGTRISKKWKCRNFVEALRFFNEVGEIAEQEQHHPDLHLTGYNQVAIEISTHAIQGLSENDFILAAKIDALKQGDLKQARSKQARS